MPLTVLAVLLLACAPRADAAEGDPPPASTAQSQFELLKARMLQQKAVPLSAAGVTLPSVPVTPAPAPVPGRTAPPQDWSQAEREREVEFDHQFGDKAYKRITDFSRNCMPPECNFLATADIIRGAYDFVDLRRDVEAHRVEEGSPAFAQRNGRIKVNMRQTLEEMRPQPGGDPRKQEELIQVSDPIVHKVFSPAELLEYARRNASSADTAPYYEYLGRTLNAAGNPGQAREAFDAALTKEPRNQAALSGRAEASYRLGDFPAAVRDARAALQLKPTDMNALTTLNFAKERVPPGAKVDARSFATADAGGLPGAGQVASVPGAVVSPQSISGRAEDGRRPDAWVAEARRQLRLGDARAAGEALDKALAQDPNNGPALALSAMVRIRNKDYSGALAAAEAGLKLAPGSVALLDAKSFALNRMKDYRGALAAADRALAINPRDPIAHFNRAMALRGLHDRAGMLAALNRAIALDQKFAPVAEDARNLPEDADLVYLFPGEAPAAAPASAPPPAEEAHPAWLMLVAGALVGLAVAALFMLLTRRAKR